MEIEIYSLFKFALLKVKRSHTYLLLSSQISRHFTHEVMLKCLLSQDKLNKFSILLKSKFKYLYKNFAFIYFALKSIKSFSLARRELFTKASLTTPLLSKNTLNSKFHSSLHSRSRDGNVSQVRVV